jgi:hypothetical protein
MADCWLLIIDNGWLLSIASDEVRRLKDFIHRMDLSTCSVVCRQRAAEVTQLPITMDRGIDGWMERTNLIVSVVCCMCCV